MRTVRLAQQLPAVLLGLPRPARIQGRHRLNRASNLRLEIRPIEPRSQVRYFEA